MNNSETLQYRTCFGTDAGRRVLAHLLIEAGIFDTDLKTTEELAVENYAKKILKRMGVGKLSSMDIYVQKLFELPIENGRKIDGQEDRKC